LYWRQVFDSLGLEERYVIASRNPLSVASSLQKRDGIPEAKSYLLWLEHMLCALCWTTGRRRIVVDYDRLLKDPGHDLRRIRSAFQLPKLAQPSTSISDYSRRFLSKDLRHWKFPPSALEKDPRVPRLVGRLGFTGCCHS
jgi:hypothetical protein